MEGNYYRIIDMEDPYEPVTLSDLIEPAVEFISYGIKSGDFEEEDMNTALTAITNWVSLEMNQKKELEGVMGQRNILASQLIKRY